MKLVGYYFKGVVASGTLSPDSAQDVARVNADRGRVALADGAGDTGASAGDWAHILSLCYAASRDEASTSDPEWIRRATDIWNTASHVGGLAERGASLNRTEVRLFREGVEASFIGATFAERPDLSMQWVAAGDCEVMLFRNRRLITWAPVISADDFSSFPGGVSSKGAIGSTLQFDEWRLESGDTILFASDALACHILRECAHAETIPPYVDTLLAIRDWNGLRHWVETRRGMITAALENDDVAIVRVRIEQESFSTGSFSLRQEQSPASGHRLHLNTLSASPLDREMIVPVRESPSQFSSEYEERAEPVPREPLALFASTGSASAAAPPAPLPNHAFRWAPFVGGMMSGAILYAVAIGVGDLRAKLFARGTRSAPQNSRLIAAPSQARLTTAAPEKASLKQAVTQPTPGVEAVAPVKTSKIHRAHHTRPTDRLNNSDTPTVPMPVARSKTESTAVTEGESRALITRPPMALNGSAAVIVASETKSDHASQSSPDENADSKGCAVAKNTKLFALDDESRKIPLLRVDANSLRCSNGPDKSGQMIMFIAWLSLPANTDPSALQWVDDHRLPDASNVWIAPNGEYLGNLKKGTSFTVKSRRIVDKKLWLELDISAVR